MRNFLPPLIWLRSFEAAGRNQSFAAAAEELNVTPSAISQQIRALETHMGHSLFHREKKGISLNEPGHKLLPRISAALDSMNDAMRDQRPRDRQDTIKIRTTITFANLWLVPKLDKFKRTYPDVDFQIITASGAELSPKLSDVDVEICYDDVNSIRTAQKDTAEILLHDDLFPVCSPMLLTGKTVPLTLSDLGKFDLLTVNGYEFEWEQWLEKAGTLVYDLTKGTSFDQSIMAIQATINAKGFFLSRHSLIQAELDSGRLIEPFDIRIPSPGAYYLNISKQNNRSNPINAFIKWLRSEVHDG